MRPVLFGWVLAASVVTASVASGDGKRDIGDSQAARRLDRRFRLSEREVAGLERLLIGTSEDAVIRLLGRPVRDRGPDGHPRLNYRFGRTLLSVYVRDGRVVRMEYGERQTGVREDDMVGLIGP